MLEGLEMSESDFAQREMEALNRCDRQIRYYQNLAKKNRFYFHTAQASIIVLSGLTPILILLTDLPGALKALPSALSTIASGLLGVFQWKECYIRMGYTAEALVSERLRYMTRTTHDYSSSLTNNEALDRFITKIENITLEEVADWKTQMSRQVIQGADS